MIPHGASVIVGGITWDGALIGAFPAVVALILGYYGWKQGRDRDAASKKAATHAHEVEKGAVDLAAVRDAFDMQKSIADQANHRATTLQVEVTDLSMKLDEQIKINKQYRSEFDQYRFESMLRQDEMRRLIDSLTSEVAALKHS